MKKTILGLFCLLYSVQLLAADTVCVKYVDVPVLLDRRDNVLCLLRVTGERTVFDGVAVLFDERTPMDAVRSVKLYYGGTEAPQYAGNTRFAPQTYIPFNMAGKTREAHPAYSVLQSEKRRPGHRVELSSSQRLFPGVNYFWVSVEMNPNASLLSRVGAEVEAAWADDASLTVENHNRPVLRRVGVGVRQAGDDGVAAFRIPGLVTTKKGTLLGVYDVRYNSSADLQEWVNVGLSRSTDGGRTWEKMRLPLAFGRTGGLPLSQNGVGDPAILVDETTGTIWVMAAWTHGMGNGRAWWNSMPGMTPEQTAQLVLSRSDDDGKTWSEPINITEQVKDSTWYFLLQGPGRGITMQDGTLVFASQFIDSTRIPNAGIVYSTDHGRTWHIGSPARSNTTESQVAEIRPGVLMLNMRDNRGGSRAVAVTEDMGRTWTEHSSSRNALREPVCMGSLLHVRAEDNVLNRDILLFSNPNTIKGRNHITIKASLDGGLTWPETNQVLLDEDEGWGYSCLTLIDPETIGILYESSVAHMTFQAIKLTDIVK